MDQKNNSEHVFSFHFLYSVHSQSNPDMIQNKEIIATMNINAISLVKCESGL